MRFRETFVISLANQKGGCGKTTASVSLAAAMAARGLDVCLVDTDPQCNATEGLGVDRDALMKEGHFTLADIYISKKPAREIRYSLGERFGNRLSIIVGNRGISTVESRLEAELHGNLVDENFSHLDADDIREEHRNRLRVSLNTLRGQVDVVIIDTPPDLGFVMTTALLASDHVIIPVFPSGYDLKGLETLVMTIQKVKTRYNPQLLLAGVLLGNVDPRAKLDADIRRLLTEQFEPDGLFDTVIHRSVKHREATVHGLSILEHAAGHDAAEQYLRLADELTARLERSRRVVEIKQEVNRG